MTSEEYIFKNATRITEQRVRAARKLQANETRRWWKKMLTATFGRGINLTRGLLGSGPLSS
jgi:hypothetical protein